MVPPSFNPQTPPTILLPLTAPLPVQFVMVPLLLYPQTPPALDPVEVTVPLLVQYVMVAELDPHPPPTKLLELTAPLPVQFVMVPPSFCPQTPPTFLSPLMKDSFTVRSFISPPEPMTPNSP